MAQTAIKSASLIAVLLVTLLFYAFSANIYFSNVRTGEAIDYKSVCSCLTEREEPIAL